MPEHARTPACLWGLTCAAARGIVTATGCEESSRMTAQVPDPSARSSLALQRKLAAAEEEVARLRRDLAEARAELAESREAEAAGLAREAATGEVLRAIAS